MRNEDWHDGIDNSDLCYSVLERLWAGRKLFLSADTVKLSDVSSHLPAELQCAVELSKYFGVRWSDVVVIGLDDDCRFSLAVHDLNGDIRDVCFSSDE